MKGLQ